ncbi:MAG: GntR family transcriptional regulator, partial [Pseudonocardiaceae bacterium]|nr:GntR family transcriptional regulator [Pseudonocardiaceae bacterium]
MRLLRRRADQHAAPARVAAARAEAVPARTPLPGRRRGGRGDPLPLLAALRGSRRRAGTGASRGLRLTVPRPTLLRTAYDYVRAAVIEGALTPGSRVTVRPLAEHLGLSPTPIKAALATLEREGFLLSIPHRGYFVPHVDTKDLLEIYE